MTGNAERLLTWLRTSANPAATLQAPTPMLRIDVGYNSAVYTGMMVLPALIVNFPFFGDGLKVKFYASFKN